MTDLIIQFRELCYLCSQRAARNVPVYTRKLEEQAEQKNAHILAMAEQRKAEEAIQREMELKAEQRRQNREVAAYNKGKNSLRVKIRKKNTIDLDLYATSGAALAMKEKLLDENKTKLPHVSAFSIG